MNKFMFMTSVIIYIGALGFSTSTLASDERPEHFKGKVAETIDQALAHFSEHNKKLAEILAKESLSPRDIATVHELTYTLENALQKMNANFSALTNTLESVHLASETTDSAKVKARALQYLKAIPKTLK